MDKTITANKTKLKRKKSFGVLDIFFIPFCLLWCYPFIWLISNAFKTQSEMFMNGLRVIPETPTFDNFLRAWESAKFDVYMVNSFIVTTGVVILVLFVAATSGYALRRDNFPGKKIILALFLGTMFFPKSVSMLPLYQIINAFGLNNTYAGIILAIGGPAHVMAILLFMRYFATVPKDLEEAAHLDGAPYPLIFVKIMIPLAKPVFATVAIFNFISSWNDFMAPLIFTLNRPELRTLGVGLYAFFGEGTADWTGLCAAATIATIPIMIVFLLFQNAFIDGLEGAVKG